MEYSTKPVVTGAFSPQSIQPMIDFSRNKRLRRKPA